MFFAFNFFRERSILGEERITRSIVINEGDGLGKKWRGLLLSAEAARNTIFGYFPKPQGAGYRLDRTDFLTSNAAQQFANDAGAKVGSIQSATQGFFTVVSRDAASRSESESSSITQASTIDKKVRVVVTLAYYLDR